MEVIGVCESPLPSGAPETWLVYNSRFWEKCSSVLEPKVCGCQASSVGGNQLSSDWLFVEKTTDRCSRDQMRFERHIDLALLRGKKHQSYQKSRNRFESTRNLPDSTSSRLLFRETRSPFRQAFRGARKCRQTQCKCQCIFHTNSG